MSHPRRAAVPNSWDDDDWISPSASTSISNAPIVLAAPSTIVEVPVIIANQQPKTLYKPEIRLLKRASPSASPAPAPSRTSTRSEEKERKEKERKEKERRYQEAKDRIFAASSPSTTTASSPVPSENESGKGKGKGKQSGGNSPRKNSPSGTATNTTTTGTTSSSARRPQPQQPQSTGAITGFSLNSGSFSSAPIKARERQEWQLRQVALDGKMLESQAQKYGFGRNDELLGDKERGLDWDEFRRDRWEGGVEEEVEGRLERLDFVEVGESADEPMLKPPRKSVAGTVTPVREPRGPDSEGRGFSGRGRGGGKRGGAS
ncbi:hypothetical protein BZA05DRAFT_392135 [Tricharina praecox]|uniref:uncharacterized protein n=1 Tax=Tricharina praecox TaxID=43433 RepID=UPI002220E534|nr:uncharacterized protein BZA05DRAFT_392135 [Tricharina praecox]KAI5854641.1 hypothetical protein BZA05DRAFT_392135 [Tricharina praecox]